MNKLEAEDGDVSFSMAEPVTGRVLACGSISWRLSPESQFGLHPPLRGPMRLAPLLLPPATDDALLLKY